MTDAADWVVETQALTKVFTNGLDVKALDDVSLQIGRGEFVAIMGPSGSGKSTLLHLIGALDRQSSGRVQVNGHDLAQVGDLDHFRAREIGFVFQMHNLLPMLTALENIEVPMQGIGVPANARRLRARELLDMVGLVDRGDHLPAQLSGGQRQRVAVARALANDPALILADEPTGNLDSTAGAELVARFVALSRSGHKTILLVTHDPVVALSADRIITLRDGRVDLDQQVSQTYLEALDEMRNSPLGRLLFGEQPVGRAAAPAADSGVPAA